MRIIGQIETEANAKTFRDYLYVNNIENSIEPTEDGGFDVWVHDEEELKQAASMLQLFMRDPTAPEFIEHARKAEERRKKQQEEIERFQKNMKSRDDIFAKHNRIGRLTAAICVLSVIISLITWTEKGFSLAQHLYISLYSQEALLPEIRAGQIWRLVTPIFMHANPLRSGIPIPLHLIFNMMWMLDLGTLIEKKKSPWQLLFLILLFAIPSNLGQFIVSGPAFMGMSGVIYGLLGYAWIRGRLEPFGSLHIHKQTFNMMIIWFFLCLFGIIPNVANTAHAVGLATGLLAGYIATKYKRHG